ncbi:MAG: hypothetical protein R2717_07850 [Schumannella sp.]
MRSTPTIEMKIRCAGLFDPDPAIASSSSGLADVLRARGRQVHDRVHTVERGGEPLAGREVTHHVVVAGAAAQDADVMPAGTQRIDGVTAEPPRAAGDEDCGALTHDSTVRRP